MDTWAEGALGEAIRASRRSAELRQALAGDRSGVEALSEGRRLVAELALGLVDEAPLPLRVSWTDRVAPEFMREWALRVGPRSREFLQSGPLLAELAVEWKDVALARSLGDTRALARLGVFEDGNPLEQLPFLPAEDLALVERAGRGPRLFPALKLCLARGWRQSAHLLASRLDNVALQAAAGLLLEMPVPSPSQSWFREAEQVLGDAPLSAWARDWLLAAARMAGPAAVARYAVWEKSPELLDEALSLHRPGSSSAAPLAAALLSLGRSAEAATVVREAGFYAVTARGAGVTALLRAGRDQEALDWVRADPTLRDLAAVASQLRTEPVFDAIAELAANLQGVEKSYVLKGLLESLERVGATPERSAELQRLGAGLVEFRHRSLALTGLAAHHLRQGRLEEAMQCLERILTPPLGERLESPRRLRLVEAQLWLDRERPYEAASLLLDPELRGHLGMDLGALELLEQALRSVDGFTATGSVELLLEWALAQPAAFWFQGLGPMPSNAARCMGRLLGFLETPRLHEAEDQVLERLSGTSDPRFERARSEFMAARPRLRSQACAPVAARVLWEDGHKAAALELVARVPAVEAVMLLQEWLPDEGALAALLALEGDNPALLGLQGRILLGLGRTDEAAAILQRMEPDEHGARDDLLVRMGGVLEAPLQAASFPAYFRALPASERLRGLGRLGEFPVRRATGLYDVCARELVAAGDLETWPAFLAGLPAEQGRLAVLAWVRAVVLGLESPVEEVLRSGQWIPLDEALTRARIAWLRLALLREARLEEAEGLDGLADWEP